LHVEFDPAQPRILDRENIGQRELEEILLDLLQLPNRDDDPQYVIHPRILCGAQCRFDDGVGQRQLMHVMDLS